MPPTLLALISSFAVTGLSVVVSILLDCLPCSALGDSFVSKYSRSALLALSPISPVLMPSNISSTFWKPFSSWALNMDLKKSINLCISVFGRPTSLNLPSIASRNISAMASSCTPSCLRFGYRLLALSKYVYFLSISFFPSLTTYFLVMAALTNDLYSSFVNKPRLFTACITS